MKGGGSVRGMVISRKAYTEFKACWVTLVHAVNLVSKPAYRRAQKTTNTCHFMQNAGVHPILTGNQPWKYDYSTVEYTMQCLQSLRPACK